jgi:hypothetical protein
MSGRFPLKFLIFRAQEMSERQQVPIGLNVSGCLQLSVGTRDLSPEWDLAVPRRSQKAVLVVAVWPLKWVWPKNGQPPERRISHDQPADWKPHWCSSSHKIWPYMVQYLHFRILKISHWATKIFSDSYPVPGGCHDVSLRGGCRRAVSLHRNGESQRERHFSWRYIDIGAPKIPKVIS